MPSKRKDTRTSKGIALDNDTWQLLDRLAMSLGTNRSNLIEKLVLEKYGDKYDEQGKPLEESSSNTRGRSKAPEKK